MARAKKQVSEVLESEVQNEIRSVAEVATEVKSITTDEPKDAVKSETEKVNDEIADVAEEAEAEVEKISESAEAESKEVDKTEKEADSVRNDGRYFSFDKREARRFFVDPDKSLGIVFYKRLIVGIRSAEIRNIDDIMGYASNLFIQIEALIKSLRFEDIKYERFDIDEREIYDGYDLGVMSIDVPYTDITSQFVFKINNMIKMYFKEAYIRASSNVCTSIDASKNNCVLKGFVSFASFDKRDGTKKVTARAASFISNEVVGEEAISQKTIDDMNRYIIALNKINVCTDEGIMHKFRRNGEILTEVDKFMDYYQVFRGKVRGILYEVDNIKDGSFDVKRVKYTVNIRTKKLLDGKTTIPCGIKLKTEVLDTIRTSKLTNLMVWDNPDEGMGFLGDECLVKSEANVSNLIDDLTQIQENILDNIDEASTIEVDVDKK